MKKGTKGKGGNQMDREEIVLIGLGILLIVSGAVMLGVVFGVI